MKTLIYINILFSLLFSPNLLALQITPCLEDFKWNMFNEWRDAIDGHDDLIYDHTPKELNKKNHKLKKKRNSLLKLGP